MYRRFQNRRTVRAEFADMTPSKFVQLRNELNRVIDKEEDFVCIIKLMNDNVFGEEVLGNGKKDNGEDLIL